MFYAEIVASVNPENERGRNEMDSMLGVTTWPTPTASSGSNTVRQTETVPAGAPDWWHGDEEASQMFFREMGIN